MKRYMIKTVSLIVLIMTISSCRFTIHCPTYEAHNKAYSNKASAQMQHRNMQKHYKARSKSR